MSTPSPAVLSGAEIDALIERLLNNVQFACGVLETESFGEASADLRADVSALLAQLREARKDSARIDAMERWLRPLPWGGTYIVAEVDVNPDDTTVVCLTLSPSSGDAPVFSHGRNTLREAIDAAMEPPATTPQPEAHER